MTVVVHPTQSGHVRIVVSSDGPSEAILPLDEARDLARRLLWAVGQADEICREVCTTMRTHSIEGEKLLEGFRLMAEILRGLEWSGWDERFRAHMCPVCWGKNKHFLDCDLNKALSFLRGVLDDEVGVGLTDPGSDEA